MKKIIGFFSLLLLFNCESNGSAEYCDIIAPATINLVNPQFINLTTPAGWAYATGGPKGLIMYNAGSSYKAFSRECPVDNCASKLVVENDIKMVCPCDENVFSILDGSPQTTGISKSVCEFRVTSISSTVLNVSNY